MINTLHIKQKLRTVFTVGSATPKETILIIGSCRAIACLNYLNRYNEANGQPFRIHFIDPYNYIWDEQENVRGCTLEETLTALESDARVLEVLRSATIYIHEFYKYFGIFNSSRDSEKNIFQFGLNPKMEICFPNFHDRFVLFQEQVQLDQETKAVAQSENYDLSPETVAKMRIFGLSALEKFYEICRLSSFPEMEDYFRQNWTKRRLFWTGNHVSRHFTLFIFRQMNERFLHLPLDDNFWREAEQEDMFQNPHTSITKFDVAAYGLEWNEEIKNLTP